MPSLFSRLRPGPGRCPRWLWGRRPRRLLRPPPPPEDFPGPAFIGLSSCLALVAANVYRCCRPRPVSKTNEAPPLYALGYAQVRVAAGHTRKRTPTLEMNSDLRTVNLLFSIGFPFIGSVGAASDRLARKACAGTRPN